MKNANRDSKTKRLKSKAMPTPSASRALKGYVYQREASLWLGLYLIIEKGVCEHLEIEPADEEDALALVEQKGENELTIKDAQQIEAQARLGLYPLSIQIKSKSTGPWRVKAVNDVLKHGTDRMPAVDALHEDPERRYLLITDAALQDTALDLGVRRPLEVAQTLPKSTSRLKTKTIKPPQDVNLDGRIGVLYNLSEEVLRHRIRIILSEYLKIPSDQLAHCKKALSDTVFTLMETDGGHLTRQVIEDIAREHDGLPGPFGTSSIFVEPKTYSAMRGALEEKHALLIAGPSGTGKTTVAHRLVDDIRKASHRPNRVLTVRHPSEVPPTDLKQPQIIYVDDPFGHYALSEHALLWKKILPEILRRASANQRFIVTTRTDLMSAAKAERLREFTHHLNAETYDASTRNRLYDAWLKTLPLTMEPLADQHRKTFLRDLDTPLEFKKFFSALQNGPPEDLTDSAFLKKSLKDAKDEAIEDRLVDAIKIRNMEIPGAVVWGFLEAFPILSVHTIDEVMSRINAVDTPGLPPFSADLRDRVDPAFGDLVAKHSVRKRGSDYNYQHNRDEKGLRLSFAEKHTEASEALSRLVAAMLRSRDVHIRRGGATLAVRIIKDSERLARDAVSSPRYQGYPSHAQRKAQALKDKIKANEAARMGLRLTLTPNINAALDDVLLMTLLQTDRKHAKTAFDNLAAAGSESSPQARLARWLAAREGILNADDDEDFFSLSIMPPWIDTEDNDAFYEAMEASEHVPDIIRLYVSLVMPGGGFQMLSGMIPHLYRPDPDIGGTFRKTLIEHVDRLGSIDATSVSRGAFHKPEQCDDVSAALSDELDDLYSRAEAEDTGQWDYINNIMPDDEQDWHGQRWGEDIHAVETVMNDYVNAVRHSSGWTGLRCRLSSVHALTCWLGEVSRDDVGPEELRYIHGSLREIDEEATFWRRIQTDRTPLKREAWEVVCQAPTPDMTIHAIAHLKQAGATVQSEDLRILREARGPAAIVQTAFEWFWSIPRDMTTSGMAGFPLDDLEPEEKTVFASLRLILDTEDAGKDRSQTPTLPADTLTKYRLPDFRVYDLKIIEAIHENGGDVSDDFRTILSASSSPRYDDSEYLTAVVEMACELGFANVVMDYLDHDHACVPATLVEYVLKTAKTFPKEFRALLNSKSRSLLKPLWAYLEKQPVADVQTELEKLLLNEAMNSDRPDTNDVHVPYASRAAKRLSEDETVSLTTPIDTILSRIRKTPSAYLAWDLAMLAGRYATTEQTASLVEAVCREEEPRQVRDALLAGLVFEATEVNLSALDEDGVLARFQQPGNDFRVLFAMLFGLHGSETQIAAFSSKSSSSESDRLLSLPLAVGRYRSAPTKTLGRKRAADAMIALEPSLRKKALDALGRGQKLIAGDIRSLAHTGLRAAVCYRLDNFLFEEDNTS